MALTQDRILELLGSGEFDQLVGEFESETLEVKGQPYRLASDENKMELAKDVSGLANASGGLLLVGFETRTNATHGEDQIVRVRAFPLSQFDKDQHSQVIASWLWPPVEDVEVLLFPASTDPDKAVAAIVVPAAREADKPILLSKTILDTPRRVELVFGYCERKQARVTHYDISRLHELLRDGRRLDGEIRSGFESVLAAISELEKPEATASSPSGVDERITAALEAVKLEGQPNFILSAVPPRSLDLQGLFESRRNPLVQLLDEPAEIRSGGFDVDAGGNSRLSGTLRRASIDGYRLLEAHRDGVVIFVAEGGADGLCWGRRHRQEDHYLVNQLFLVEVTYLFCRFVRDLYSGTLAPGENVELRLEVRNLAKGTSNTFLLESGPLSGYASLGLGEAPAGGVQVESGVTYEDETSERWAAKLLSEFYAIFGYEEDRIPYTKVDGEVRVVDPELILAGGR